MFISNYVADIMRKEFFNMESMPNRSVKISHSHYMLDYDILHNHYHLFCEFDGEKWSNRIVDNSTQSLIRKHFTITKSKEPPTS